jgi:hypothetical protein
MPQMDAEILFLDPGDVSSGSTTLTELGFKIEVLNYVDEYGPTVWIKAGIASDLSQDEFLAWVSSIVEPLRGEVAEAGFSDPATAESLNQGAANHA